MRDSDGTVGIDDKVFNPEGHGRLMAGRCRRRPWCCAEPMTTSWEKAPARMSQPTVGLQMTLDANYFSDATQRRPYGARETARMPDWFDPGYRRLSGGWFWQSGICQVAS